MPSNSPYVCVPCRYVARQTTTCPHCGDPMRYTGYRWRAPRRTNDRAWARIARGDWLWERSRQHVGHSDPWQMIKGAMRRMPL